MMGSKLLFFFLYLSFWVKKERKYSALWKEMLSNLNPWGGTGQMSGCCLCTYPGGLWEGNFRAETIQIVGCQIAGYWPQIFSHIWMADVCVIRRVGVSFCFFSTARTLPFYEHLRWGGGRVVEYRRSAAISSLGVVSNCSERITFLSPY